MRSALEPLNVEISDLEVNKRKFNIKFDASKTEMAKILAALKAKGEDAKALD